MPNRRCGDWSAVRRAFGEVLRERRLELGLTQEALASRSGLDRTYVGGVERGERNPTLRVMCGLAEALDTHPGTLLTEAEGR